MMTSNKKKNVKKTETAKVEKKKTSSSNNKHIFAGFLLGLCVGMLFFGTYLVTLFLVS